MLAEKFSIFDTKYHILLGIGLKPVGILKHTGQKFKQLSGCDWDNQTAVLPPFYLGKLSTNLELAIKCIGTEKNHCLFDYLFLFLNILIKTVSYKQNF